MGSVEIRVKTLDERRTSRVSITIRNRGGGEEVTSFQRTNAEVEITELDRPDQELYTADEVADAQYSEAELVARPLRVRVTELERDRADLQKKVTELTGTKTRLMADLETAVIRVGALVDDVQEAYVARLAEKERADKAESQVQILNGQLHGENGAWGRVQRLATRASKAREVLTGNDVRKIRSYGVASGLTNDLLKAVDKALDALNG